MFSTKYVESVTVIYSECSYITYVCRRSRSEFDFVQRPWFIATENSVAQIEAHRCVESVPLDRIFRDYGTPCYVYSRSALTTTFHEFDTAFAERDHLVCYAVKANPSLAILNLFAKLGSGFDIVSGGELQRVLKAGGDPQKIVFSGVGKRSDEIRTALAALMS